MDDWIPQILRHPNPAILANSLNTSMAPKVIAHITADRTATAAKPAPHVTWEALMSYFMNGGADMAPHLLWDPFTGQIVQFFPASSRSLSVLNGPQGQQTNRMGKYVIQIEAVFFPYTEWNGKVYAKLSDTPCKNWDIIHKWIKGLGIPDVWPSGVPKGSGDSRNLTTFETKPGWYGHSQVPWNDHVDPMSWPAFPVAAPPVVTPPKPPVTTPPPVHHDSDDAVIADMQAKIAELQHDITELTADEKTE